MTANYISISLTREQRTQAQLSPADLIFPFDNGDTRSITKAKAAADAIYEKLIDLGIAAPVGIWLPCNMLNLPVISGDPQEVVPVKPKEPPRKPPEQIIRKWARGRIGKAAQ